MKTATENPEAGQVVETVTRKRVVPVEAAGKERTTPDFWIYFENLKPADWERHMLYIYRKDGETGPMTQLEKSTGHIIMGDGARVPLSDREETEFAIIAKYGGGTYRLILKRGSERVTETRIYGDGPRKQPQPGASYSGEGPTVTSFSEASATADVAKQAMHTIAGQERAAFDVASNALQSAANVVQRLSQAPAAPAATADDQMFRALMLKMMERMMAPPPDPLEVLTRMVTVLSTLGLAPGGAAGGGGALSPMFQKVIDVALDKVLNPSAPAGPASDNTSSELVRALPGVAQYAVQGIAQWRAGVEAQRDTAAIMRGATPPPPGNGARPSPTIIPPPPADANGEGQVMAGAPSLEFIETRIVGILKEPISAEEAGERVLEFLDTIDPSVVAQLKALGEAGLLHLFQSRPVLQPAMINLPRLQEFIRAFLKFASEGDDEPRNKPI